MLTTTIIDSPYRLSSAPKGDGVDACWVIHIGDKFDTQIGNRLERRGDAFRFVLGDGRFLETDTQRGIDLFIRGILIGRCLC